MTEFEEIRARAAKMFVLVFGEQRKLVERHFDECVADFKRRRPDTYREVMLEIGRALTTLCLRLGLTEAAVDVERLVRAEIHDD